MNGAQPVRLVVAGAGLIGQEHIKRILAEPAARLAGIVDTAPQAKTQAETLDVPWAPDLATILGLVKPDGVIVSLPNQFHFSAGMTLVERGIPMLMEKPVCATVDEALRLADAAEKAAVPVLVGHHRRHSPLTRRAKEIIDSGRLGTITAVVGLSFFLKSDDYYEGKFSWRRELGAGVVMINLIHVIDDLRNLCGDIVTVQAVESNAVRNFAVEDTAAVIVRFANGALGTLTITDAAAAPWCWEMTAGENKAYPRTDEFCYIIAGTKASLSVPRLELWHHGTAPNSWSPIHAERIRVPDQDPYTLQLRSDPLALEMRHFCDVVRRTATPLLDARGGACTLEATLAVKTAAATGQTVHLSSAR
jgi:predicted dehydrogenase